MNLNAPTRPPSKNVDNNKLKCAESKCVSNILEKIKWKFPKIKKQRKTSTTINE